MTQPSTETEPLHPTVVEIGKQIAFPDPNDGSKADLPAAVQSEWTRKLKLRQEEKPIFMHLAVLALRLQSKGLAPIGETLIRLAQIGLKASELEKTMNEMKGVRASAEKVRDKGPALAGTGGMPTGRGRSAGLRGKK